MWPSKTFSCLDVLQKKHSRAQAAAASMDHANAYNFDADLPKKSSDENDPDWLDAPVEKTVAFHFLPSSLYEPV